MRLYFLKSGKFAKSMGYPDKINGISLENKNKEYSFFIYFLLFSFLHQFTYVSANPEVRPCQRRIDAVNYFIKGYQYVEKLLFKFVKISFFYKHTEKKINKRV